MTTYTFAPGVITLDPVTRIEGHLKIQVQVDDVGGQLCVVDAWSTGTLFRGFEKILENRHPWDAVPLTQRICGVCPVSHGLAAVKALDAASSVTPPSNGRIMRNFVLGANFIASHVLHFYHLALLDYVAGPGLPPWEPSWKTDLRLGAAMTQTLVEHYLAALEMRRIAQEAGAVFGGRLPMPPAYIPGGFTHHPNSGDIKQAKSRINDLIAFIQDVYIPDVVLLGNHYGDYFSIGRGPGNLLAYGVFDLDAKGQDLLLKRGRVENGSGAVLAVDLNAITEDVTCSWYDQSANGLKPASGQTDPQYPKNGAYSWLKAPRYGGQPYEVGPLARMTVNGDYTNGISVMDRHMARALEALKVAQAMKTWLGKLKPDHAVYKKHALPQSAQSYGLTEAPRGALGHWVKIQNKKIAHYQVVTPTCWNASPRDTYGLHGPIEEALIGTAVQSMTEPIELLRVVHSFDPCLSCAVHVLRPGGADQVVVRSR